jgi:hypothetical protein
VAICGIPYPNFGDRYEKARFNHNPNEARIRIANMTEQGSGRHRRGDPYHYGPTAEKLTLIAGGSKFKRLKSAFSYDFMRSVI